MKEKTTDTPNVFDFGALPYATHARLTVPVTILKGINPRPRQHITLSELLAEIETTHVSKLNHAQSLVCAYEQYLQNVEKGIEKPKKAYESKKEELYGFQLGKFAYRNDEKANCLEYVPCQVFDLDGCNSTYDVFLYQQKLKELDYVFAAFASPSGYGLRIFIWTNASYDTHQKIYLQILELLCRHLEVTTDKRNGTHFDASCKNESRHFFYVAVDTKAFYLNLESKTLEIQVATPVLPEKVFMPVEKKEILTPKIPYTDSYTYIDALNDEVKIEYLLKGVDMNKPRKIQCFYFGCVCRENNVDFDAARRIALHRFYDSEQKNPEKVVEAQLKDGYNSASVRYDDAQFMVFLRNTHKVIVKSNPESLEKTTNAPVEKKEKIIEKKRFTADFYARLPELLKKCTDALPDDIEKKVFFLGSLGTLSSLMPRVLGLFREEILSPHLYIYVVASGGAGKGALRYAMQILSSVLQKIREENTESVRKQLVIPANITTSLLIQLLQENDGNGLLFETEGGLLAQMFKLEHSNYSLQLRQGYHHEAMGLARMGNGQKNGKINCFVEKPRIAAVFSGTFDQLIPLVKSGEDGLLSRFALLTIQGNYEWKDANPKSRKSKQILTIFKETADKVLELYEILRQKDLSFDFTEEQWIRFDNFFRERKPIVVDSVREKRGETGAEICNGIINRLGIFAFRTAMIFTVLRYFEARKLTAEPIPEEIILCSDGDLETILELVEWVESTALEVLDRLPTPNIPFPQKKIEGDKAAFKAKHFKEAFELKKIGKSYAEIAKIIFGDENLKGTIHRWLH